jgi:hypothetical protein
MNGEPRSLRRSRSFTTEKRSKRRRAEKNFVGEPRMDLVEGAWEFAEVWEFHNCETATTEKRENRVGSRAGPRAGARLGRVPGSQARRGVRVLVIPVLGPTWPRFARREPHPRPPGASRIQGCQTLMSVSVSGSFRRSINHPCFDRPQQLFSVRLRWLRCSVVKSVSSTFISAASSGLNRC